MINTAKAVRSVSKQGQLQPCCYSMATSLSRQLYNGLLQDDIFGGGKEGGLKEVNNLPTVLNNSSLFCIQ